MAIVGANAPVPSDRDRDGIPAEIRRDRWGRPLILQLDSAGEVVRHASSKHKGEPVEVGYTRASGLGGVLEDSTTLTAWKLRTAVFGLARSRPQIVAAASIATTTEKPDKQALDKIVERAHILAGNDDKSTLGTALHALGERLDRGEEVPDIGEDRWALKAYQEVMTRCFRVLRSEAFVAHDGLQTAGTFDRLVELLCPMQLPDGTWLPAGTIVILDIKTSGSSQYFGIKFCVQLAVYQGGQLYDAATGKRTPLGAHPDWGVILHVPSGGNMAELFWVDLRAGRELAEMAIAVKQARKRKGLVIPATLPALPIAAVSEPVEERVNGLTLGEAYDRGQAEHDAAAAPSGLIAGPAARLNELAERADQALAMMAEGVPADVAAAAVAEPAAAPFVDPDAPAAPKQAHAASISGGLMQAHARRQLAGMIGRVASEAEALALYQANARIWDESLNEAVRARLAELRAHGVAS